jgi:hypothetical protein
VQLTGSRLGQREGSKLFVYGAEVKNIAEWTDTKITFVIPPMPADPGQHAVWIENGGGKSNARDLAIVRPYAEFMVPDPAMAGKLVTITGRNFGTTKGKVITRSAKDPLEVLDWTENKIKVRLARELSGEVELKVVNENGSSIPMLVNVMAPPPTGRISGPVGDQVSLALDDNDIPYILTFERKRTAVALTTFGQRGWRTAQVLVRLGKSTGDMPKVAPDLEKKIADLMKSNKAAGGDKKTFDAKLKLLTAEAQKEAAGMKISVLAAGHFPRVLIDPHRTLHITMYDMMNQKVMYATRSLEDAEWQFSHVNPDMKVKEGLFSSLALDSKGRIHVAYMNAATRQVMHAIQKDGIFVSEAADPEQNVGVSVSLALDPKDNPMLAYLDYGKFDLKAAVFDGKEYRADRIDSEGWTGDMPSIVSDEKGNPVIAFMKRDDAGKVPVAVKLATRQGDKWSVETVEAGNGIGNQSTLLRDSTGRYHLAYLDENAKSIRYCTRKGTTGPWDKQSMRVDDLFTGLEPQTLSMAVASDGTARVAYWTNAGHLEFRQFTPK